MKKNYMPILQEFQQNLSSAAVGNEEAIDVLKSLAFQINQEEVAEALPCPPSETLNPEP